MLLIQASKANSEPGQTYKIRILAKFVNGLKFILRLVWRTLRVYCLDTWISDTRDPTDLNARKNHLFRTFQSLGLWLIEPKVITGFLQLLGSLRSLVFHLFFALISFSCTREVYEKLIKTKNKWKTMSMEFRANTSYKNPTPTVT